MACLNCSAALDPTHRFCPACGQSVAESRDRSFGHLARTTLHELVDADGRLWQSVKTLVGGPGQLSRTYRLGQRRRFLTPIGLFLLANMLFFLAPPISDLQLNLDDQYHLQPHSPLVKSIVDGHLNQTGNTFDTLARRYELKIAEVAKVMVFLHVPVIALCTLVLFADRRFFFADHVVLAMHYFAFLMVYFVAVGFAFGVIQKFGLPVGASVLKKSVQIMAVAHFIYVPAMLKTGFDVPWWRALLFTPLFCLSLLLAHFLYRLSQFFIGFVLIT